MRQWRSNSVPEHPPAPLFMSRVRSSARAVRVQDEAGRLVVPPSASWGSSFLLRVRWTPSGSPSETAITPDPVYGSFDSSLHVPTNARYDEHTISFVDRRVGSSSSSRTLTTATVVVADPRPPTVELVVDTPEARVLAPGGSLNVRMSTHSLSGVALKGQRVTLRWSLTRGTDNIGLPCEGFACDDEDEEDDDEEELAAEETHVTGDDGSASSAWHPIVRGTNVTLRIGDELQLSFEFIGPTRERVSASLTIPVASSENTVDLSASDSAELPNHPFDLTARVAQHSALGGAAVPNMPVQVSVYAVATDASDTEGSDGDEVRVVGQRGPLRSHGDLWCKDVPRSGLPSAASGTPIGPACELTSTTTGSASTKGHCQLQLPTIGRFLAVACATGPPALCTAIVLGRSTTEWHRRPLHDYLPLAVAAESDRPRYALGDVPSIRLTNPLSVPLRALMAWGNVLSHRHLVTDALAPGDHDIPLAAIGDECARGCDVSVTLVAAADGSRRAPVPASPLLDMTGPMLARFTVTLDVAPPADPVRVALQVGAAVAQPGGTASLTLTLTDSAGQPVSGQVALFGVDKALLQVRPHPVQNLSTELTPSLPSDNYASTDTYSTLVAPSAIGTVFNALQAMLAADPWLSVSAWRLKPDSGSDTERPLAAVLASHTTEITDMPSSYRPLMFRSKSRRSYRSSRSGGGAAYAMEEEEEDMEMGVAVAARAAPMMMMMKSAPMAEAAVMADEPMMRSSSPIANSAPDESGGSGGGGGLKVKVRSAFETTPLFLPAVEVDATGSKTLSWTLPDNTGAYELRAYVVKRDGGGLGGGVTATQLVRKRVTLDASVPRVARVGDVFRCGVTATGSPDIPAGSKVVASLALQAPITTAAATSAVATAALPMPISLTGGTVQHVTLGPSENVELAFEMRAEAVGEAILVAAVHEDTPDGASDAIELRIPVLGVVPDVTVATSMALRVSPRAWADGVDGSFAARIWPEAIQLPAALPGSGTLLISAATGRLAAVKGIANGVLALPRWQDGTPCAPELLAAVAASAMLRPYADAVRQEMTEATAAQALLPRLTSALATLTRASSGLHYSVSSMQYSSGDFTDLHLNALGLFLLRRLRLARVPLSSQLESLGGQWRDALTSGLVRTVDESISRNGEWRDLYTLAASRLALGAAWRPRGAARATAAALSLDVLATNVDSMGAYSKAAYALTLLLPASPADDAIGPRWTSPNEHALGVLRYFASCLRVTARSAYIARDASSRDAAGRRDTALVLSALSIGAVSGAPTDLAVNLDKLANHVASGGFGGGSGGYGGYDFVGSGSLFDGLALGDYDSSSGSLNADLALRAFTAQRALHGRPQMTIPHILYNAHLRASDAALPLTRTVPWSVLPPSPPPAPLIFSASGFGEVSVALAMQFTPAALFTAPVYRGIEVAKIIRQYDALHSRPIGPPLAHVPLGMMVTVTLQVTSPDEISNLVVDDWLPAGLEAVDPNADGGASSSDGHLPPLWPWLRACGWWWRCTSWSRETKKDAVTFYAAWAHAGTHTLSFEAIAATRGHFSLPPAKASAALQPEVMGLSAGGALIVADAGSLPQPLSANSSILAPERRCPNDCSGRGTCDGATGTCACRAEAAGADCSLARVAPAIGAANANDSIVVPTGGADAHIIYLPLHCPKYGAPNISMALDDTPLSPSPPPPPPPPPPAQGAGPLVQHLYAISSDEVSLPSSALTLTVSSRSRLDLAVHAAAVVTPTCVRVTVAASLDGMLFGSRVIALWLAPAGAADATHAPPVSCMGDGVGYVPAAWESSAPMPHYASAAPAIVSTSALVLVAFAAGMAGLMLRMRAQRMQSDSERAKLTKDAPSSDDFPDPTDSPGSQQDCFPATSVPTEVLELSDADEGEYGGEIK